tara:strand:- start:224 stop:1714 length:1491 start_codon:yes stop_codon:yes gene_type:complete
MGQSAQRQDMFSVPSGGIADFYMSDEDLAVIEQEEAQKAFGSEGVAAFDTVAKRMASYGRFGDDRIVHVESGEIVVPRALIEQSPELKESIFSHLREQGVEDPERYVVGSSANSLNPETGLPEFFLSKLVKKVGKVLKKAAPVILPIALSMTPLGPIYGAALGSGIGTLMQGGDIEDALKNAVIAGGTGAVFSGVSSAAKPGGTFMGGIRADLANPGARFSQLGQGITGQQNFFRPFDASGVPVSTADVSTAASQPMASGAEYEGGLTAMNTASTTQPATDPSFLDRTGDYMFRGGQSVQEVAAAKSLAETQAINETLAKYGATSMAEAPLAVQNAAIAAGEAAAKAAGPGIIERFGPSVALAGLGATAAGLFKTPEVEEPEFVTGAELLEQNRDKYALPDEEIQYVAPYDPFVPQRPVMQAAEGGVADVFPRRTGGIMPDEGIAGEDSVRAMLMPGEFVMTTDAVKGLGNGDNDQGIRKMYDMMRGLEAKGRAMA